MVDSVSKKNIFKSLISVYIVHFAATDQVQVTSICVFSMLAMRLILIIITNNCQYDEVVILTKNKEELESWRSQNATSEENKQALFMLSCVLNSERAIVVNIQVIRVFSKMHEMLLTHKDILLKLEQLAQKVTAHDKDLQMIFTAFKKLLNPSNPSRERIGFRRSNDKE